MSAGEVTFEAEEGGGERKKIDTSGDTSKNNANNVIARRRGIPG